MEAPIAFVCDRCGGRFVNLRVFLEHFSTHQGEAAMTEMTMLERARRDEWLSPTAPRWMARGRVVSGHTHIVCAACGQTVRRMGSLHAPHYVDGFHLCPTSNRDLPVVERVCKSCGAMESEGHQADCTMAELIRELDARA